MKKYYYIYQITNLVNNKIYVGVHETFNLEDGYMGSGKVIRASIKKHGIINFRKDILEFFEDSEAMYAREKEIVTDEFLLREDTYNLRRGGTGGFDYINKNELLYDGMTRIDFNRMVSPFTGEPNSRVDEIRKLARDAIIEKESWKIGLSIAHSMPPQFFGKKHTDSTKQIMSAIAKERLKDSTKNSQYGTMWITNGIENKKIKKDSDIPDGWYKGRIV